MVLLIHLLEIKINYISWGNIILEDLKNNSHISISELISDWNNSGLRWHQHISYNISSEVRDEPYKNMIVDQEQILVNDRLSLSPIDPSEKQISDDINKLIEILRM